MILETSSPRPMLSPFRNASGAWQTGGVGYRYALSRTFMGLGEALHTFHKNDGAIQYLTRAVDLEKSIATVSPRAS
jgi:hypothetical protein